MKAVFDADLLSTFSNISRLDILNDLFQDILVPPSVVLEMKNAQIKFSTSHTRNAKLTREELLSLRNMDPRLGRGERECLAIAGLRMMALASDDKIVHQMCKKENIDYLSLPRILRLAILSKVMDRKDVKDIVRMVERRERTVIRNQKEIFK